MIKEDAYKKLEELIKKFEEHYDSYHKQEYNETLTRRDFIDPFFKILNWDVDNEQGFAQSYRDVIHEDKVKVGKETKAPDYSFRIGGKIVFYVEAKKPSVELKDNTEPAYQVRRYGWSAKLGISLLTDFEELAIYDCTKKPNQNDKASTARIKYINYKEYLKEFDFLWDLFNKENILKGSLEKYTLNLKDKKGTEEVGSEFLNSLDNYREKLASNISKLNSSFISRDINFTVQQMVDRIIFLRIAEDRGIENYGVLRNALSGENYYQNIFQIFLEADGKYNSGLFDFSKDATSKKTIIDNKVIKEIVNDLYYPKSPYEFSVLPVEILGSAYEQFLGKTITITDNHKAKIEYKPEVRKAGGVYYTPEYIVDYIVENTVGEMIKNKTPKEIEKIKIVDPACGSGSFLLGAYKYLLNYHKKYYNEKNLKGRGTKEDVLTPMGELTTRIKKSILINNIYGVDIDVNAVEVTKLSLLIKCLEGETPQSLQNDKSLFNERALPSLEENVKCGNSLIGSDFYSQCDLEFDEETIYKINCFDWDKAFPTVFKSGGFDCVIGNPPYVFTRDVEWGSNIKDYFTDSYNISNANNKSKSNQSSKVNLYALFIMKSYSLLKEDGYSSFIVPNGLLRTTTYDMTRKFILENFYIKTIADLKEGVFQGVTASTIIFIFSKSKSIKDIKIIDSNCKLYNYVNEDKIHYIKQAQFLENTSYAFNIFSKAEQNSLFNKMNKKAMFLGNITSHIIEGIVCRKDQIFNEKIDKKNCKLFLEGKNIKRYKIEFNNKYIVFDRAKLHRARPDEVWSSKKKIIIQRISGGNSPIVSVLDIENYYTFASTNLLLINTQFESIYPYEIICALLNSKLINFYYVKNFTNASTQTVNISKTFLEKLPLPNIDLTKKDDKAKHDKLVTLVDKMLELNKKIITVNSPHEKEMIKRQIDAFDSEIDKIVYRLYNLTDEEIKVVEGE